MWYLYHYIQYITIADTDCIYYIVLCMLLTGIQNIETNCMWGWFTKH